MTHDAPDLPNKRYLATQQYRDASNLNARAALHIRYGTNSYPWFRWVFDQALSVAPNEASVLEVGAGPGGLWRENLDRLPTGWRVTLTDLSAGMVEEQRAALADPRFTFAVADVEALPFANASFDLVIANHMLYHVPDRPKALAELRRALRPGGALVAATNGAQNIRELDNLIHSVTPDAASAEWRASFRHPFTLENGAEQLAPYFEQIETRRYDDALDVTEPEPLVAYILSIDSPAFRAPGVNAAFEARARELIAQGGGAFHITKSVGLFVARRRA
ncbi:MAG TPA: class I SAM-dependent methyltransferase [Ktedonobacterales bacterium]|nr:class I SAM-dependent methyltransferase [Ktedonobacterales bacterium]